MTYGLTPAMSNQLFVPDQLIAGDAKIVTRQAILAAGQNLLRGTILGMITSGSVTSAAGGSNTGNATIGAIAPDGLAIPGTYTLTALTATTWNVVAPDGSVQGVATTGTPFEGTMISFLITAGGTANVAGDTFTITVPAGTDEVTQWAPAASNGSQNVFGILADSVNATSAAQRCSVYLSGEFNERSIILPAGSDITETLRANLRLLQIHLKNAIAGDIV